MKCKHGGLRSLLTTGQIVALYVDGMSGPDIAEMAGTTAQSIYQHLRKSGVIIRTLSEANQLAATNGKYNVRIGTGSGWIDDHGYKRMYHNGHQVHEHRLVWERNNGPLPHGWVIHHLNGTRSDNRIDNLSAMPRVRHSPMSIIEVYRTRIIELEEQIKLLKGIKS